MLQSLAHLPRLHPFLLPQLSSLLMVKGKCMGLVLSGFFLDVIFKIWDMQVPFQRGLDWY